MDKIVIPPMTKDQLTVINEWLTPEEPDFGALYTYTKNLDVMIDALLDDSDYIYELSTEERFSIIRSFRMLQKELLLFRSINEPKEVGV